MSEISRNQPSGMREVSVSIVVEIGQELGGEEQYL